MNSKELEEILRKIQIAIEGSHTTYLGNYILDKNGDPKKEPGIVKWGKWMEKNERHIADDKIGDVRVSTVFLGLDHSFTKGKPILFETMVFGGEHDEEMWRYKTKKQAIAGHNKVLNNLFTKGEISLSRIKK